MPLPVSHSLVGAIIVTILRPRTSLKRDWLVILFGAFLAVSPDFDFFFDFFFIFNPHMKEIWHRGLTHSIFFAVIVTCFMLVGTRFSHFKGVIACGAALTSHGVLDFLTTKEGKGVELLFPFSDERLKLGIFSVSEFDQGFPLAEIIKSGLIELTIFLPIFLVIALLRGYLSPASSIKVTN